MNHEKTLVTRLLAILVCVATLATVTPIFAAAETTITEITITDADVTPYIGEKAGDWLDYTLPENCHFTMTKHFWYNETDGKSLIDTDTFEADISYQVGWWLEADEGYTFAEDPTITINGQTDIDWENTYRGDTIYTNEENKFFVWTKPTEAVEKPAATVIDKIEITDADVTPYIGEKAGDWLDYTLPENCHFTMAQHYWYNETVGGSMKADEVFAAGSKYDLCWRCEAESGYTFDAGTTVTINGSTTLLDDSYTKVHGDDPTVFVVWTKADKAVEKPAATVIDKIEITNADVTPYIGEKAGDWLDYTLPENCHFTVAKHYWYNETVESSTKADEVFAAGSKYDLCWRCEAESGYTFDAGTTVTINGSTTLLDDSFTEVSGDDPTVFFVWTKPTEAVEKPAANVIDKIEILDADVTPYIGEKAGDLLDYTLPDNCHYTMEREYWHREGTDGGEVLSDDVFEEGVRYDRYWYFKADEGYIFDENAVITINGSTALVDTSFSRYYENAFSVWTKPTEAVENTVINKIEITDVDVLPIIGEKTNDHIDYTFSENCHFTAAEHGWYDRTDRTWVESADDTFVAGHIYQVGWWLDADEGYTFAEDPTITINGGENINWEYTYIDEENPMRFYVWTKPTEAVEPIVIDKIEINGFCDPVVGGKAGDYTNLTLPEDAPYYFYSSYWYNDTDDHGLSSGETFEAGKKYSLGGWLVADEGYVFAEDPEVLFNGGEYPVDEKWTKRDDTDEGYFYVWSEPKEAVEKPEPIETTVDLRIGDKEFYGVKGGETLVVESLDAMQDITVLVQNGVDIEGMSEDWSMSTKFLDSEGRGVLEVQVFEEGDDYVTFNLQSHYADCPGASVDDFQIMMITVKVEASAEKLLGDANDDGAVNMKDVLMLRKQLAGMSPEINMTNADCNGDGDVNMKDVLMLRKYLAGLIEKLGA